MRDAHDELASGVLSMTTQGDEVSSEARLAEIEAFHLELPSCRLRRINL
jgi:hypothetical protein